MCEIYVMAKSPEPLSNKQLKKCRNILRSIAIASETRGAHSSGLAVIGDSQVIHKSLLPSSKFVSTKEWSQSMKMMSGYNIYLGHTRFATQGAVTQENAHPFRVGDTIGAHNGCLYNMAELEVKLDKSCEVDSQLIFKSIEDCRNIQDAVKHLDGDFALSFVKDDMNTLNLCREENRPLYACYISSLKSLFYASEEDFLEKALISQNVKSEIWSLATNRLYSFDISKFAENSTNVEKIDFEYESTEYIWTNKYYDRKGNFTGSHNIYYGDGSVEDISKGYSDGFSEDPVKDVCEAGLSREDIFPFEDRYQSRRWTQDDASGEWYWLTDDNELILSSSLSDDQWREVNEYYEDEFLFEDFWFDAEGHKCHRDKNGVLHHAVYLNNGVVSDSRFADDNESTTYSGKIMEDK